MDYSLLQVDEKIRYIHLSGDICRELVQELCSALVSMTSINKKPILLVIDSIGGDIDSALACFDLIRLCPAPVYGNVVGNCLSAALLIYLACDKREASINSRFLIHDGTAYVRKVAMRDLVPEASEEQRIADKFNFLLAQFSGNTIHQIERWSAECTYFTALEAKKHGFADRVVGEKRLRGKRAA